jgi:hypothetical protein
MRGSEGLDECSFVVLAAIIISSVELKLNYGKCCCSCRCRCVSFSRWCSLLGTSKSCTGEKACRGCSTHSSSTFQSISRSVFVFVLRPYIAIVLGLCRDDMQGCVDTQMITISRMVTSQMDELRKTYEGRWNSTHFDV